MSKQERVIRILNPHSLLAGSGFGGFIGDIKVSRDRLGPKIMISIPLYSHSDDMVEDIVDWLSQGILEVTGLKKNTEAPRGSNHDGLGDTNV